MNSIIGLEKIYFFKIVYSGVVKIPMANGEIVQGFLFFETGLSSMSPHPNNIRTTLELTQSIERQEDSMARKWEASAATEHCKDCHGWFNWHHPKTRTQI